MEVGVDMIVVGSTWIEGVTVIEVEGMGVTGVEAVVRAHYIQFYTNHDFNDYSWTDSSNV